MCSLIVASREIVFKTCPDFVIAYLRSFSNRYPLPIPGIPIGIMTMIELDATAYFFDGGGLGFNNLSGSAFLGFS
jgi:hypothetical protein